MADVITNTPRLRQLRAASAKVTARLEADPRNPKAPAWRARLAEYDESMSRLAKGLRERTIDGPIGTHVTAGR